MMHPGVDKDFDNVLIDETYTLRGRMSSRMLGRLSMAGIFAPLCYAGLHIIWQVRLEM
jgi:hypothetical protein